ncbi:MAG: hypothetical protein HY538_01895 [Deltaproteobacteria bacterium]|nr:hypothetical protein [Deltaproteobacteria bacterium]
MKKERWNVGILIFEERGVKSFVGQLFQLKNESTNGLAPFFIPDHDTCL